MTSLTIATIQCNASTNIDENLKNVGEDIGKARSEGAEMVFLPENVAIMDYRKSSLHVKAREEEEHSALLFFQNLAREEKIWIQIGSLAVKQGDHFYNRSFMINDRGEICGRYDKIHLFDVDLDGGESYRESSLYNHGEKLSLVETPWGKIGLTICYDLRFPYLYRDLAKLGCVLLSIPAAFTYVTGKAHWHSLLRSRAIENGCYVVAAAQTGTHDDGRRTYGHSLIIDPWGKILSDMEEKKGFVIEKIDINYIYEVRKKIPSLANERMYEI